MADDRVMQSLLLDFYGQLLTDKQRETCELYFNEDLSLAEIAEQCGISRQGVWDNVRRAVAALEEIEEKTGLVRRFSETQRSLELLRNKAEGLLSLPLDEKAHTAACELSDGLKALLERG